jgi:hypothetical protein
MEVRDAEAEEQDASAARARFQIFKRMELGQTLIPNKYKELIGSAVRRDQVPLLHLVPDRGGQAVRGDR